MVYFSLLYCITANEYTVKVYRVSFAKERKEEK